MFLIKKIKAQGPSKTTIKMTDVLKVVREYCSRKNIELLELSDDFSKTKFERDNKMRIYKHSIELCGILPGYYIEYNRNPTCVETDMSIIKIIEICKEITDVYEEGECSVCFEKCRKDLFKCKTCVNITCNGCLSRSTFENNSSLLFQMASSGISIPKIIEYSSTLKKMCPVCRQEHGYV